jgi:Resolvase, N terminal domain
MKYGYARVSTDGQSVAAQVAALNAAGAGKVFREVASGAKTDRSQLRRAIASVRYRSAYFIFEAEARTTRARKELSQQSSPRPPWPEQYGQSGRCIGFNSATPSKRTRSNRQLPR